MRVRLSRSADDESNRLWLIASHGKRTAPIGAFLSPPVRVAVHDVIAAGAWCDAALARVDPLAGARRSTRPRQRPENTVKRACQTPALPSSRKVRASGRSPSAPPAPRLWHRSRGWSRGGWKFEPLAAAGEDHAVVADRVADPPRKEAKPMSPALRGSRDAVASALRHRIERTLRPARRRRAAERFVAAVPDGASALPRWCSLGRSRCPSRRRAAERPAPPARAAG